MDSLRRLTSSVFDGGHARLGRRQSGSGISAFLPGALGGGGADPASVLDLTFITEQLVVCGFPVTRASSKKANEINVDELAQYLETHHSNHYLIFNLNALDASDAPSSACASPAVGVGNGTNNGTSNGFGTGDGTPPAAAASPSLIEQLWRKAPQLSSNTDTATSAASCDAHAIAAKVREQMLEFSWERDGMKAHTPPFDLIFRICYSIFAWLSLDAHNVAVVNCQTGKTRSGVVVACYLLFARLADDPIAAFVEFYRKRWDMRSLTPQALRSKTPPSIQRFLASFHTLVECQRPPNDKPMVLKAIIFRALPLELQPCVQIWDDYRLVFCTDLAVDTTCSNSGSGDVLAAPLRDPPVLDWNGDDGFFAITWESGVELDGGFSIICSFGDEYDGSDDSVDASSRVLFRYADSTWFLSPGLVTLTKSKLDMMKQYEHGFDDEQFSVDLVLHEHAAMTTAPGRATAAMALAAAARRSHVRLDYTGNNAVRQGLLEITKHHIVLPDPAMHSNFIRMGFGETPTTFALQRSQNTPNVALDLLHSEMLAVCSVREDPDAGTRRSSSVTSAVSLPPHTSEHMPAGEPTTHANANPLRRQTTAEIVAMQSQRSRYSTPTALGATMCRVCREDDYMTRSQIVQCTGACGGSYHTTCVGLRKIPFGLTTLSDRTNHGVYVKKFFSAWECDACAPPPPSPPPLPVTAGACISGSAFASSSTASSGIDVPPGMTLVPASWASSYTPPPAPNKQQQLHASSTGGTAAVPSISAVTTTTTAEQPLGGADSSNGVQESEAANIDKLREFLLASGISVEDLLRAATTPNVSIGASLLHDGDSRTDSQHPMAGSSSVSPALSHANPVARAALTDKSESSSGSPKPLDSGESASHPVSASTPPKQDRLQPASPHAPASRHVERSGLSTENRIDSASTSAVGADRKKAAVVKTISAAPPVAAAAVSRGDLMKQIAARATPAAPVAPPMAIATQSPVDLNAALLRDIVAKRCQDDDVTPTSVSNSGSSGSHDEPAPARSDTDVNTDTDTSNALTKYEMMLRRGVPFAAVQNCMVKDGTDPSTLQPLTSNSNACQLSSPADESASASAPARMRLRDVDEFRSYFSMLRLGCPKDAVKHKLIMDGLDPLLVDLGPDAIYDDVKDKLSNARPLETRTSLQDDITCVREPRSQRAAAAQSDTLPSGSETSLDAPSSKPAVDAAATAPDDTRDVLLRDHETYSKYFRMLKMGLPEDAVRHKIKSDGADERALTLGPDARFATLLEQAAADAQSPTLGDDPVYAKYFKMLKMGLPDGAVRHKMATDGVDARALDLGPNARVSELVHTTSNSSSTAGAGTGGAKSAGLKPKARRKKLHWQAISDDRLSSISQQTIWEDRGGDMEFDVDMDELESLFFANSDTGTSSGGGKKKVSGQSKALKRKQSVTLVDAKRAMNAAISLARVKLSYCDIAAAVETFDARGLTLEQLVGISEFLPTTEEVAVVTAYTGDTALLGEAEKFMLEMARVQRCAARMECLVFQLAFASRSAELVASYTNMQTASEEVKGSRLLKVLLSMVLKLGNSLNGSGDDNGIRGFTVDSLLRLGHTKAVNQKTTVLHYLVRLVKKNHPQVLDFHDELKRVPLAARESFDTIADDFAKLQAGAAKLQAEFQVLQSTVASAEGDGGDGSSKGTGDSERAAVTASAMHAAAASIDAQICTLRDEIARARDEVRSVFDYFGEDPNKSPTDFFATLTSFCTAFEAARKEVDAADEAALRAERMKLRRSNSVAPRPQLKTVKDGSDPSAATTTTLASSNSSSAFQLRLRDRTQSDRSGAMAVRQSTPSSPTAAADV